MSRMDKYYKDSYANSKRTSRNYELYKKIYEDQAYSNIEGIANIDKSNEIDIAKIKDLLKSREDYQSGRELKNFIPQEETIKYETFERDDNRTYDIKDILMQAKTNKEEEKYHNLDETSVNMLRSLRNKQPEKVEPEKLENMIDAITSTSKLNKLSDGELGLEVLDDLKSTETDKMPNASIQNILDQAKIVEKEKTKTNIGIDKSFFTSSLSFTDGDFDEINGVVKKRKFKNITKVIIIIIMIFITALIALLVFNVLK